MQLRWELKGLDDIVRPSNFSLGVKGEMYADRRTKPSLKGQLQMSMSFSVPPVLALVPEDIRRGVAESVSLGTRHTSFIITHLIAPYVM